MREESITEELRTALLLLPREERMAEAVRHALLGGGTSLVGIRSALEELRLHYILLRIWLYPMTSTTEIHLRVGDVGWDFPSVRLLCFALLEDGPVFVRSEPA